MCFEHQHFPEPFPPVALEIVFFFGTAILAYMEERAQKQLKSIFQGLKHL